MQINFNNNEISYQIQDTSASEYQKKCGMYQDLFKQPQMVSQNSIQSQNYLIRNAKTVSPAIFRQKKQVNEPILSNPVVIMKYQMNQHFKNQQTVQNQVREKTNSDQRKELLSFFNENRYKYFSNNDLNAEKFFVTRNRERIKDLNFERIGIFKSKQPNTHVKHLRFFVNDLKIVEPRFQNPLKIEQEQLSIEQSFRKASHASHNSKLSSSDLVREALPNFREALTGKGYQERNENFSKGVVNSPINNNINNGSNQFSFGNLNPSLTHIIVPQDKQQLSLLMQQATPLQSYQNTPSKLTAAATSPQQSSGQSKFQFSNIANNELNSVQQYSNYENNSDIKDAAINVRKLKQQYVNFVQQNFNPKLQQAKLVNNLIKEEKEESVLEEEHIQQQENQNQLQNNYKKLGILLNSENGQKSNERLPTLNTIKNNKKQRVNIIDERDQNKNQSSQQTQLSEREMSNRKKLTSDIFIPINSKNDIVSPINQKNFNNKLSSNKLQFESQQDHFDTQKIAQQLLGQNSLEFDNNYMVCLPIDKETDNEYIYSKQFQEQIKSLEDEQKRLESIENLFFLKLSPEELEFYRSEGFKIHRKKMLLDTILKNKKITRRDKKLIFLNLLYQYNVKSGLNSKEWCIEMTNFLMKNKFKYNLDEAANRKYERAHQKIVQLPTFRDPRGEEYHDSYNFFHQFASPTPISTESNEVHFYPNEVDTVNQIQFGKKDLHIKRFKPKQLSKTYSHFQFQKIKY